MYWINWPYAYIKVSYALKLLRENIIWLLMKILDIDLIVTNKKIMQKYKKLSPDSVNTLNYLIRQKVMKLWSILHYPGSGVMDSTLVWHA